MNALFDTRWFTAGRTLRQVLSYMQWGVGFDRESLEAQIKIILDDIYPLGPLDPKEGA